MIAIIDFRDDFDLDIVDVELDLVDLDMDDLDLDLVVVVVGDVDLDVVVVESNNFANSFDPNDTDNKHPNE